MTQAQALDPKNLPERDERQKLKDELSQKARTAILQNQPLVASLHISDALMLYPNERVLLDQFDEIVFASPDPLSLFPVATGAIHVATAAGRARVLMIQKRLPDAVELIGRVLEVAPELEYLDWVRRWLQPHVIPALGWDLLMGSIVRPTLQMTLDVPVPADADDIRLPNLRSANEIFTALLPHFPNEKILYVGAAMVRRRLGDTAATLAVADEGVRRFPDDWGLRTALLNALRDAHRPDEAYQQAQVAMQLDPQDFSPLHDAAWGYITANRFDQAANLFQQLLQRDPNYPTGQACLHYARIRAWNTPEDRTALLAMRERKYWDSAIARMANEIEPPVEYVTYLPGPADASSNYAREMVGELAEVMHCCGQGANLSVTVRSEYPESPSARVAFDVAMRAVGAAHGVMNIEVEKTQHPDPRDNKGRVDLPVWAFQNGQAVPMYQYGDQNAQRAVGGVAYQLFRKDVWDPAARNVAMSAGPQAVQAFMSVFTNPPPPPNDFDGVTWTYRCQIAAALIVSHMGPWEGGPARAALYSLVSGASDWTTIAGIVALSFRAGDSPQLRTEVLGIYAWLRSLISPVGFTPWESALIDCWLALGNHPEPVKADLLAWQQRYEDTVESKNSVQTQRRYGGLTIEQYAQFCSQRDKLQGGLAYGGAGAALMGALAPSQQVQALCQKFGVNPHYPFVTEWQEALNASPGLMEDFIEAKRSYELEQMGVSHEEKGALDNIIAGNMDMHQRMAQAQDAQRAVAQGSPADQDPDPLVFPGQRVQRLSDYVGIMKGMQRGDMMGALGRYGLDMMSYGQVATAWGAKMAADPVLTEKFSRMMAAP
jgi:tetratricopeptide (TPR) repeat protein